MVAEDLERLLIALGVSIDANAVAHMLHPLIRMQDGLG